MWYNNYGEKFNSKADAFDWLNNYKDIDIATLYFDGEIRYKKTPFGIFDCTFNCYHKGNLPVERY